MELPLIYYDNPNLRQKTKKVAIVNDEIRHFVNEMLETLIAKNGVGLAAPQVNRLLSIFITYAPIEMPDGTWAPGTPRVFINPEIIEVGEETDSREEGCLSIPGIYIPVERSTYVKVRSLDLHGNPIEQEFHNYEARVIQHENDHINGVLMIDHLGGKARRKIEAQLRQIKKQYAKRL